MDPCSTTVPFRCVVFLLGWRGVGQSFGFEPPRLATYCVSSFLLIAEVPGKMAQWGQLHRSAEDDHEL